MSSRKTSNWGTQYNVRLSLTWRINPTETSRLIWWDKVEPGMPSLFWICPTGATSSPTLTRYRKIESRVLCPSSANRFAAISFSII